MIARALAYWLQEDVLGGLEPRVRKVLAASCRRDPPPARYVEVGSVIVREYQGEVREVLVVPGGFCWRGAVYGSLSTTARQITGTNWNGPRFFSLRVGEETRVADAVVPERREIPPAIRIASGSAVGQPTWRRGMKPLAPKRQRCAIYTLKSTEHNLDVAFNSLDAQREACDAYIKARRMRDGGRFLANSITKLFHEGRKPAVEFGTCVSRVGGKTQARAREAAEMLRLDYAQFLELEIFARFGGMPDTRVRDQLTRGARIRAILAQPQHAPLRLADEVALILSIQSGLLDPLPLPTVATFRRGLADEIDRGAPDAQRLIEKTGALDDAHKQALRVTLWLYAQAATPPGPAETNSPP